MAPPDLLDLVRTRCALVASTSTRVTIDADRLTPYATGLTDLGSSHSTTSGPADPWAARTGDDDERRAALVIALDAINFGSGYHPQVAKLPGLSGARTMATRLRTWAADEGGIRATTLAELDRAQVQRIFAQPETDDLVELMGLFTAALNELGRTVATRHAGSFLALVRSAGGSAATMVEALAALPTYADVSTCRGTEVPFYKRAQITVADLHRAFAGAGPGAFADVARLTAFADNLVPHVLRVDGVLVLDPSLEERIDRGELLRHGEEAEVELRACGIHAVERLRELVAAGGREVTSAAIDQILWERGGDARYKAIPRPRARTTAY